MRSTNAEVSKLKYIGWRKLHRNDFVCSGMNEACTAFITATTIDIQLFQ